MAERQEDLGLSLDQQLCFALYSASRSVTSLYRPILEELQLTYPQYLVMLVLWERGPVSVKELGTALRLDSGTLSPLLKRMEANGLVLRSRRPDDERSVEIGLTESGSALQRKARQIPGQLVCALGIPVEDIVALRELLQRLNNSIATES